MGSQERNDAEMRRAVNAQVVEPKVPLATRRGRPIASAVFCRTVLPHQLSVKPPLGYWGMKNHAERDADAETRGEDVVEPEPPAEVVAADEPLEEASDHRPGRVVDAGRGWELREAGEAHGDVNVAVEPRRVPAGEDVERNRKDRVDEEDVEYPVVHSERDEAPPTPPQMMAAVAKVEMSLQTKPSFWVGTQKSSMLANCHS